MTGWSTADGSKLWTVRIDGWRPRVTRRDALQVQCTLLRPRPGTVRVRESGRTTRIRMKPGEAL